MIITGISRMTTVRCMASGWMSAASTLTASSGADVPMPYAANLEKLALPDAARVVAAVKAVLNV